MNMNGLAKLVPRFYVVLAVFIARVHMHGPQLRWKACLRFWGGDDHFCLVGGERGAICAPAACWKKICSSLSTPSTTVRGKPPVTAASAPPLDRSCRLVPDR
eukprot:scaffold113801_cov27-Prasinocladus_malaysianus.AAC.1